MFLVNNKFHGMLTSSKTIQNNACKLHVNTFGTTAVLVNMNWLTTIRLALLYNLNYLP